MYLGGVPKRLAAYLYPCCRIATEWATARIVLSVNLRISGLKSLVSSSDTSFQEGILKSRSDAVLVAEQRSLGR